MKKIQTTYKSEPPTGFTSSQLYGILDGPEEMEEFGFNYGTDRFYVTREAVEKLLNGGMLGFEVNGGEYSLFVIIGEHPNEVKNENTSDGHE